MGRKLYTWIQLRENHMTMTISEKQLQLPYMDQGPDSMPDVSFTKTIDYFAPIGNIRLTIGPNPDNIRAPCNETAFDENIYSNMWLIWEMEPTHY